MLKVRNYKTFCGIMDIVTNDFYRIMFNKAYYDAFVRLRFMKTVQPLEYDEYLSRWNRERSQHENIHS